MKIESNSMMSIVMGVFILFITWLFFNGASGYTIVNRDSATWPAKIIMNTILSSSAGGVIVYATKQWILKKCSCPPSPYVIIDVCSGILAGLVSITAACNNVAHWSAILIGVMGGIVYSLSIVVMNKLKIDDPVEAS